VTSLELPFAPEPFRVIKLPLGVTDTSYSWHGIVTSQQLPGWISDNLPPAAVSHPEAFLRDAKKVVEAIKRYSEWF